MLSVLPGRYPEGTHQMAQTLTARTIETIKPGQDRREIADRHMPGLYLVLQPSGARSWAVRYRHAGRPRKHTLGSYPAIDLKSARDLAGRALRTVAEGRDPGREKAQERTAKPDTIEAIAKLFIERHCHRSNRPRTARETQRLLDLHVLPRWRGRLVRDITRRDVLDLLDRVVDSGKPIAANRVLSAVRKMLNWCVARDILAASPCTGVKPPTAERSRDRVLTDPELHNVWQAADKVGGPFGDLVKLLVLTGQRRDEVAGMEWSEINLEVRLWTLPPKRVKNNEKHEVPLSEPAIAIMAAMPRVGDRFVLTSNGEAPSSGYSKGKRRLDALLPPDMPRWRLHDIRRTAASGMAKLGVNLPVIEKVLNHSSGSFAGIVGVYQQYTFADEKRRALDAWGAFVADLVSDRPRGKVVRLRRGRP
jgi:integrase